MDLMRFTIVDAGGAVSFVSHGEALAALLASCAGNPTTIDGLLAGADDYHHDLRRHVLNGLAIFDEHNTRENATHIHRAFAFLKPHEQPAFRIIDDRTREESLRPVKAGAVIFNLLDRRIVQLQNTYRKIARVGRGHIIEDDRMTSRTFLYRLPRNWAVVP